MVVELDKKMGSYGENSASGHVPLIGGFVVEPQLGEIVVAAAVVVVVVVVVVEDVEHCH